MDCGRGQRAMSQSRDFGVQKQMFLGNPVWPLKTNYGFFFVIFVLCARVFILQIDR